LIYPLDGAVGNGGNSSRNFGEVSVLLVEGVDRNWPAIC
jgi:hypothetical protein